MVIAKRPAQTLLGKSAKNAKPAGNLREIIPGTKKRPAEAKRFFLHFIAA
jgi:hypothetical protein